MKYYQDKNGDYITLAEGSIKNTYAFFRIDKTKPQQRGSRIKTRPMLFFSSMAEGFLALEDYAKKRQWKIVGPKLPTAKTHQALPHRYPMPPLFTWIDRKNCETEKPAVISDEEYEQFKGEIVQQAVVVAQRNMKDWNKPDLFRAIQVAMTNMQQSSKWSSAMYSELSKRISNDTGGTVNSKYQIENMLGGVFVRVECQLLEQSL
jgi:hypothetical protein